MSYNNPRNYNTRQSGRFNRPGSFVPASSMNPNHQTYDVPQLVPPPPAPPMPPLCEPPMPPMHDFRQDDDDVVMNANSAQSFDDSASTTTSSSRLPFFKTKMGLKKISNKERRRRQNALLRRLTSPKNALMCINEMLPNEQITNQFKVEPAPLNGMYFSNGVHNFCAELTLDGVTYKGYGENKLVARNAAAEQAIRDIVLKKMERYSELLAHQAEQDGSAGTSASTSDGTGAGTTASGTVDALLDTEGGEALPMIQLLSFALHKLFAEWEGAGHHVPQLRTRQTPQVKMEDDELMSACSQEAGAAEGAGAEGEGKVRKAKKIPQNASSMHPAMLLTILRPHAPYRELACEGDRPQNMMFTVALDVDDQTYIGKATNKKEARKAAARAACKAILGITFDDEKGTVPTMASN